MVVCWPSSWTHITTADILGKSWSNYIITLKASIKFELNVISLKHNTIQSKEFNCECNGMRTDADFAEFDNVRWIKIMDCTFKYSFKLFI